ncbi:hypothetical protein BU23DRAFT_575544 [Bimuria novae-zelandiae CBS 107.79]|uniref:Uncharacterized protein n=1 Tax=Bimuria novae-zelandiae CBS 107.79 TaxID=1447943 RepID=A0A6A5ULH3_9PLEO|nr:hypothetical protein BU23DRAFT_575544 [Bimuria novae-zelandiae CBS 107.79]
MTAQGKRKRPGSDIPLPHALFTIDRKDLIARANTRFPEAFAVLPDPTTIIIVEQTLDRKGGKYKIIIGRISDGTSAKKILLGAFTKFPDDSRSRVNVTVFKTACLTVQRAAATNNHAVTPAITNTLEDADIIFIKTCKRCRRIEREESGCRSEDHAGRIEELEKAHAAKLEELATARKNNTLLRRDNAVLGKELAATEVELKSTHNEVNEWKDNALKLLDPRQKVSDAQKKAMRKKAVGEELESA